MEVIIDGIAYVPKEKSEIDILKEKYESGDYICVVKGAKWFYPKEKDFGLINLQYIFKLIHEKHKDILDAYLKDNLSVKWKVSEVADLWHCRETLIEEYNENYIYEIKQKEEYPIFKVNDLGEIWKFIDKDISICMLSDDLIGTTVDKNFTGNKFDINDNNYWSSILYNKKRGLYHKQPVWGIKGNSSPRIYFYNYNSDSLELITDFIYCDEFTEIIPITPDQLKTMPFIWDMYKKLED